MRAESLAAENFLLPNGTFFVELAIFLLVFAVIWLFVVPPIREVLDQREARVTEAADHRRQAREAFAAAEDRYRSALARAHADAARLREQARNEGRAILVANRDHARDRTDEMVATATAELRTQAAAAAARFDTRLDPLAHDLADRVIGGGRR
ncbi:F0F1 ATP synthase subunit B [Nocardia bhagyanarayanae]|uniref:ATP synthase subunit b n=1 Tax=Nocardia bhagyanarayanae TaxID=1215925 RepID=A0A543FGA3_9NOCA|nr:F0F1 ATP synthase subunit B [Nocardia bhagyanarayanae]TQM32811.1 F-type H+-transporting ATPase subunit b [Nocardia bhagyanarayanae]